MARHKGKPLLTREVERELIAAWQDRGCVKSRDKLVEAHILLAHKIAYQCHRKGMLLEDLQQEACLGLLHAANKFNQAFPVRFSTYAQTWCQNYCMELILHQAQDIRPSSTGKSKRQFWKGERIHLIPIDKPLGHSTGETIADAIPDNNIPDVIEAIDTSQRVAGIMAIVDTLRPREKDVILRRTMAEGVTLEDIAQSWGVTRERVRQIEMKAIRRVKCALREVGS